MGSVTHWQSQTHQQGDCSIALAIAVGRVIFATKTSMTVQAIPAKVRSISLFICLNRIAFGDFRVVEDTVSILLYPYGVGHGNCHDTGQTSFFCACLDGWSGATCEVAQPCSVALNPCGDHGSCTNDATLPSGLRCNCDGGWTGPNCLQDVDDCFRLVSQSFSRLPACWRLRDCVAKSVF